MQDLALVDDRMQTEEEETVETTCFPTREFNDIDSFDAAIAAMDLPETDLVDSRGEPFPGFKAVFYQHSKIKATITKSGYQILAHPITLARVAKLLREKGIQPQGYITETYQGRLSLKMTFANPEYEMDLALGVTGERDLVRLGVSIENTYGDPSMCLTAKSIGMQKGRVVFQFGEILGKVAIRHIGKLEKDVTDVIKDMLDKAPLLATHIHEAQQQTVANRDEMQYALRGIGLGKRMTEAVLTVIHGEPTLWSLYKQVSLIIQDSRGSEKHKDGFREKAFKILTRPGFDGLAKKGKDIVNRELLAELERTQGLTA